MFESTNKEILASLRDFIGDALAESDITPSDILEAIRDELKDLVDYHKIQGAKGQKLLDLLQTPDDVLDFSKRFQKQIAMDEVEDIEDNLTFGGYDFNLSSDYIVDNVYRPQAAQDVPWMKGGFGQDTISFNTDGDDEFNNRSKRNAKKNRNNQKNPKNNDWKNQKW